MRPAAPPLCAAGPAAHAQQLAIGRPGCGGAGAIFLLPAPKPGWAARRRSGAPLGKVRRGPARPSLGAPGGSCQGTGRPQPRSSPAPGPSPAASRTPLLTAHPLATARPPSLPLPGRDLPFALVSLFF